MALKTFLQLPISNHPISAFLIFMFAISMPITSNGFVLKLVPIDSIDSVNFPKILTLEERHYRLIDLSKARVLSLAINSTEASMAPGLDMIRPRVLAASSNYYIIQFSIGSENYSPCLMVDSGSDLTWVQCDRCTNCFPVSGGNFKDYESSSFLNLQCDDPRCDPKVCEEGICRYEVTHISGSIKSKGRVGMDTFSFPGIDGTQQRIPNIAFGCGLDNQNGLNRDVIAGIFGLGQGWRSFLWQASFLPKWRFSYCLPSSTAPHGTYRFLHFGDDAQIGGDPMRVKSTSLVPSEDRFYWVNLLDISVEEKRLNIDPDLFGLKQDRSGGFAIDTGSPHTLLVEGAYRILKDEIMDYILKHCGWGPEPEQPDRSYEYDL